MKKWFFALTVLISSISFAQSGKVYPKNPPIKPGEVNTYIYEAPEGMEIKDDAYLVAQSDNLILVKTYLQKLGKHHEFKVKFPEDNNAFSLIIYDANNKPLDSNNDNLYIVYLNEKLSKVEQKLYEITLWRYTRVHIDKRKNNLEVVKAWEDLFEVNPKLKEEGWYMDYLSVKNQVDPQQGKELVKSALTKYEQLEETEENLRAISFLQHHLGQHSQAEITRRRLASKFPSSDTAMYIFLEEYAKGINGTEEYILSKQNEYNKQFSIPNNQFIFDLMELKLRENNFALIEPVEKQIKDKTTLSYLYNDHARQIAEKQNQTKENLAFAKKLSQKAIDLLQDRMDNPTYDEDLTRYPDMLKKYKATYTLIMSKLKK